LDFFSLLPLVPQLLGLLVFILQLRAEVQRTGVLPWWHDRQRTAEKPWLLLGRTPASPPRKHPAGGRGQKRSKRLPGCPGLLSGPSPSLASSPASRCRALADDRSDRNHARPAPTGWADRVRSVPCSGSAAQRHPATNAGQRDVPPSSHR